MATLTRIEGFEHGVISTAGGGLFDTIIGSPVCHASAAMSGGYGLRSTWAGASGEHYVQWLTGAAVDYNFSFKTKISANPGAGIGPIPLQMRWTEVTVGAFSVHVARYDSTGFFKAAVFDAGGGAATTVTGPAFSTATEYLIECRIRESSTGTLTVDWRVDGVAQTQLVHVQSGANDLVADSIDVGGANAATNTLSMDVDDFVVSETGADYPLGEYKILGYSPNAVGTHNLDAATSQFFFKDIATVETALTTSETTSYQQIDDVPLDADSDHLLLKKVAGATTYADPNGAGTATAWTGAYTDIDDAVRQPTAPSDGLTISSSTDEQSETVQMSNPTFVAGATYTLWVYGTGGTKRAVDVAYSYNGADPGTAHATRAELIPASGAAGWRSRVLTAPANQTELDAMRVQFICNSTAGGGGATACSVNAAYLEITTPDTQPTNTWYAEHALADSGESVAPAAVRAIIALRNDSGVTANSVAVKLRANSNEDNIFSGDIASASRIYKSLFKAAAPGGAAWTDSIFDGATIRFGYSNDADSTPRLESALLVAAFPVAGASTYPISFEAALTLTPTVTRTIGRPISVSLPLTPTVQRVIDRKIVAALTLAADVKRTIDRKISAALTLTPSVTASKSVLIQFAVALTMNPTVSRIVGRNVSAPLTLTPSVTREIRRNVTAALTLTPTVLRQITRNVTAALTLTPTVRRTIGRQVVVALSLPATVTRTIERRINTALTFATSVTATFIPAPSGGTARRLRRFMGFGA